MTMITGPLPTWLAGRRARLASPRLALVLGALTLLLLAAWAVLYVITRDIRPADNGFELVISLSFAAVGLLVARRQPANAIGWIMSIVGLLVLFETVVRLYLVLDYRTHHGALPFGRVGLYWSESYSLLPILFGLQAVLLFPDARLSRRWRRILRWYLAFATLFMAAQFAGEATMPFGHAVPVDTRGMYSGDASPTGVGRLLEDGAWIFVPVFIAAWASFVGHQVAAWRHSTGERREQLKWLASGAACCVVGSIGIVVARDGTSLIAELAAALSSVAIAMFPASIGLGILKYRLYEIDRLIGRTIAYAIVTGSLVAVFVGLVALTTDVLPFSSPVGVAASTLAAAVLFNPLRQRVQHLVDRRFNRARYDAEAIVSGFTVRLRDAVDLDTVGTELLLAVERAVQPAHAWVWLKPSGSSPPMYPPIERGRVT